MASCTQIDSMLQARIDGELSDAERVILDQHVSDCPACAALLRRHQRSSALLFEALADQRLTHSVRESVLENLPELECTPLDVARINWRAKHPMGRWRKAARLIPGVVGVFLLFLAIVLFYLWPGPLPGPDTIGIVTQSLGDVVCVSEKGTENNPVGINHFVERGQRYKTGPGSAAVLFLAGPTHVFLNENTRVKVHDDRTLRVGQGQVCLEVAHDGRLFKVITPAGNVTVFGTRLDVKVDEVRTVVTLEQGEVCVERDADFVALEPGQQIALRHGEELSAPRRVNVEEVTRWAKKVVPDKAAAELFEEVIQRRSQTTAVVAKQTWIVHGCERLRSIEAIRVEWPPSRHTTGHCSYEVRVYDGAGGRKKPLFKDRIDGNVFAQKGRQSYEIGVQGRPITDVTVLHIVFAPDVRDGTVETEFSKVSAVGPGS